MLGKLLKYEVKAAGKVMPALYLGIGLTYGLGKLAGVLGIEQMKTGFAIACAGVGIAAMVLALILTVMRYAKGLFGAEGYLTQTLPVGKGTLIVSKVITGYLLILLGFIGLMLGVFGTIDIFEIGGIRELLASAFGDMMGPLLIVFLVMGLVQLFATLAAVYFSIALSNTRPFLSNNLLFSVVFFLASSTAVSLLEVGAMMLLPVGIRLTEGGGVRLVFETTLGSLMQNPGLMGTNQDPAVFMQVSLGIGSVLVDAAVGIVLLFVTRWLLTRKVSVK